MEEIIGFLLIGWIEVLVFKHGKTSAAVGWIIFALVVGGIVYAITTSEDITPPTVEYNTTEQSFIDLCESQNGTPSRDIKNPDKLICIPALSY